MISTKGRYSVRILLDLAEHCSGGYIPMKEVAARQEISLKYIERLMPALKAAGLIDSVHGAGGGSGAGILPAAERRALPAGGGVPHSAGVAGVLRPDAKLLHRRHAGRFDECAAGRQLRHLKSVSRSRSVFCPQKKEECRDTPLFRFSAQSANSGVDK